MSGVASSMGIAPIDPTDSPATPLVIFISLATVALTCTGLLGLAWLIAN